MGTISEFVRVLQDGKGFNYLTDYDQYSKLSKDQIRDIAKELIYAIEHTGLLGCEIEDIYKTVEENLIERYDYENE